MIFMGKCQRLIILSPAPLMINAAEEYDAYDDKWGISFVILTDIQSLTSFLLIATALTASVCPMAIP
jgi:hypothetical protein